METKAQLMRLSRRRSGGQRRRAKYNAEEHANHTSRQRGWVRCAECG